MADDLAFALIKFETTYAPLKSEREPDSIEFKRWSETSDDHVAESITLQFQKIKIDLDDKDEGDPIDFKWGSEASTTEWYEPDFGVGALKLGRVHHEDKREGDPIDFTWRSEPSDEVESPSPDFFDYG